MKGIDTWPATLKEQRKLTKLQFKDTALNLLRIVLAKVASQATPGASQAIQSGLSLLPKSHTLTAEEQILAAKRNIVLLLFFTITLCLLYTVSIMQVIK